MTIQKARTAALSASNLKMIYGSRTVLDVASFNVQSGEVMAIIGPNGSGKTTLLLNLALLIKPTIGMVAYTDTPIMTEQQRLELRRHTATVFQEPMLLAMSVWDNVMLGLKLRKVNGDEARQRAKKWLQRFGVVGLEKRSPRTLSGGEAKRVSLARAFALEPDLLFLDEPFTALDSPTRQVMLEDFESVLRETKVTTIMVTHDRNEALVIAHRVAVIISGKIMQVGVPSEVFNYPVNEEVAKFVEAGNILSGTVNAQTAGLATIRINERAIQAVSTLPAGKKVSVWLSHDDVTLSLPSQSLEPTSARNRFLGKITRIFPMGSQVRVTVDVGFPLVALITRRSQEEMELAEGSEVAAIFKASSVHLI